MIAPRGADDPIPVPRRTPVSRALLERFGFTKGCMKCRDIESGDNSRPALAHSQECRMRIEAAMADDRDLSRRLDQHQGRALEYMTRRSERGVPHFGEIVQEELQPGPASGSETRGPPAATEGGEISSTEHNHV